MLSKNHIKQLRLLHQAKFRQQSQSFIVEGVKLVEELLHSNFRVEEIYYSGAEAPFEVPPYAMPVTADQLQAISALSTANRILAVAKMPDTKKAGPEPSGRRLALDAVSDPGNLGTILRIADWFGIDEVILGDNCVELYNPKVVQSSMGSIFRVKTSRASLPEFLAEAKQHQAIYGAVLNGENVYSSAFPADFVLVFGSESHGMSAAVQSELTKLLSIPAFGAAESLNVAMATAIFCSEIRRPR